MITVVAALIKKDNKFLIAKRATGYENVLGKWEFPGGKVKVGEEEKMNFYEKYRLEGINESIFVITKIWK